jgi:Tetratricopeptide repeat
MNQKNRERDTRVGTSVRLVPTAGTPRLATERSVAHGRSVRRGVWTLVACLALALAAPARAQLESAPTPTPAEIGRTYFDRGVNEYNLGHFTEAIAEFEKAYKADPAPIMLFNIAQSHRQLGNKERALFFYRRYLEQAPPDAPNRSEVEQRTKDLSQSLEQEKDIKQRPPTEVAGLDAARTPAGVRPASESLRVEPTVTPRTSDQIWAIAACVAPSFATVGRASVELPVMFALRIGGAYSFLLPSARVNVALDGVFALLRYQTNTAAQADMTSTLPGFILSADYMRDVTSKLSVGGGVGFGVIWWTGLANGNPFVNPGTEVDGAIPMPTFEAELRATMDLRSDLFVILAPELLYSRATSGLSDSLSGLWRFDVNVGAGYRF